MRPDDGGFACIPGSHKSNCKVPLEIRQADDHPECVRPIVAGAGSLVVFNEATAHGTLPWQAEDRQRRSILFEFSPGFLAWGGPTIECPIANPTEQEKAVFQLPYRRNRADLSVV